MDINGIPTVPFFFLQVCEEWLSLEKFQTFFELNDIKSGDLLFFEERSAYDIGDLIILESGYIVTAHAESLPCVAVCVQTLVRPRPKNVSLPMDIMTAITAMLKETPELLHNVHI